MNLPQITEVSGSLNLNLPLLTIWDLGCSDEIIWAQIIWAEPKHGIWEKIKQNLEKNWNGSHMAIHKHLVELCFMFNLLLEQPSHSSFSARIYSVLLLLFSFTLLHASFPFIHPYALCYTSPMTYFRWSPSPMRQGEHRSRWAGTGIVIEEKC